MFKMTPREVYSATSISLGHYYSIVVSSAQSAGWQHQQHLGLVRLSYSQIPTRFAE